MSVEDRLRGLRPKPTADALKARVLAAALSARREQRLWRRTWAAAAAVLAVAIPLNLSLTTTPPAEPRTTPPPFATADEGILLRWRWAQTPPPPSFPRKEIR